MKIRKNKKSKTISITFSSDEMDEFIGNAYKPYFKNSVRYFDELVQKLEKTI
jgi:hypothetical protein